MNTNTKSITIIIKEQRIFTINEEDVLKNIFQDKVSIYDDPDKQFRRILENTQFSHEITLEQVFKLAGTMDCDIGETYISF